MAAKGKVSQPMYGVQVEKDVRVGMRDGVHIFVDIYRPDAVGKFPALISWSAYGKGKQAMDFLPQIPQSPLHDGTVEAGDYEVFVPRGYALIIPDPRGVGESEGEYIHWMSVQEAEDCYDLVEWAAQQPWCDGNVGLVGYSYFGMIQPLVAALQPPHLKAIAPWAVPSNYYRVPYNDGVLTTFIHELFYSIQASTKAVSVLKKTLAKEELDRLIKVAKDNPDLKQYRRVYQLLDYPDKDPFFFDVMLQPYDGPFYWERSEYKVYDKIKVPTYLGASWVFPTEWVRGTIKDYLGVNVPKKLILMPPRTTEPRYFQPEEQVRWFDYWLKGINNGIMDEPPIKIFVQGTNQWRYEKEWPLARTKWTKFYLRTFGRLVTEPDRHSAPPDAFVHIPPTVTLRRQSLQYTTPQLGEDIEVTGPIALYFYAAIDTDDTNWRAEIYDIDVAGKSSFITFGWLKASHRAIDKDRSKLPWLPEHQHTKEAVKRVVPGEINEYAIEIIPTSQVFRAGHKIQLEISSCVPPQKIPSHGGVIVKEVCVCSSKVTLHKIYRDKDYQSHLLLPIILKT